MRAGTYKSTEIKGSKRAAYERDDNSNFGGKSWKNRSCATERWKEFARKTERF